MILGRLVEFASRCKGIPPSMYQKKEFKWQIELDSNGRFLAITPLSDSENPKRGLLLYAPMRKRTSGIEPLLLADNAGYVLGLGDSSSPSESEKFKVFLDLVRRCYQKTGEPSVGSVLNFLETYCYSPHTILNSVKSAGIEPGDNVIFCVDRFIRPTDLESVKAFWAEECNEEDCPEMQCLVCGKNGRVDKVSPIPIKGIPDGQPSGVALVSANKDSFESYGAKQSLIAPTCRSCGEAYANALNHMLKLDSHRIKVGKIVFVFWTTKETGFNPSSILSNPTPKAVNELIASVWTAKEVKVDPERFYALALSASNSRAVVRDWLDTTVPTVKSNLARWFSLQKIVDTNGNEGNPLPLYDLASSLYRNAKNEMSKNVPKELVRCTLYGARLPEWLLVQAVNRNRAEQTVTRNRAALIKSILLSNTNGYKEGYMESLELECKSPGYLCGRLFAELEKAQKWAVNPKSTLVGGYYGAASSAPATVFGYLMRNFQSAHMQKLRKEKPAAYNAIDIRVQEILSELGDWPKTLTLKEQAMFALGYYHQKAWKKASANANRELKELNSEETEDEE